MAGHRQVLVGGGLAAALAAAVAFLAGQDGDGAERPHAELPVDPGGRRPSDENPPPTEKGRETFGDMVGRAFRTLGAQGDALRERAEGFYGMYRLLRALGMTDQEIAMLVARQARTWLEREADDRRPTAADTRRVVDALQETVVRAAEEVDVRLDLRGEFVRRVREGVQATKTGREDAILAAERSLATARELLRQILKNQA